MPLPTPPPGPVQITVVESEACHFCADAHQALAVLAVRYPMSVESVDVRSYAGRTLMAKHRAPMSPLVLVEGAYFSSGRLPRRKLEKLLSARHADAGTAAATTDGAVRRG
jgi:alkyl hydroperoxide reductase subunit AhpF